MCHKLLTQATLYEQLYLLDQDLAQEAKGAGCGCGGVLHQANYERKPRGGPDGLDDRYNLRFSACCNQEGCRKRQTPPSLRFLQRRVYWSAVVVLIAALRGGVTKARVQKLKAVVGPTFSGVTLKRWHKWWQQDFAASRFWQAAKGRFAESPDAHTLPGSLLDRFIADDEQERLILLLRFLNSISGSLVILS